MYMLIYYPYLRVAAGLGSEELGLVLDPVGERRGGQQVIALQVGVALLTLHHLRQRRGHSSGWGRVNPIYT